MSNRRAVRRAALVLAVLCTATRPAAPRFCEYDLLADGELDEWREPCLRACRWGWVDFAVGIPEDEDQSIVVIPCSPGVSEGQEA